MDYVHDRLSELAHVSAPLARAFADAGFSLYAVGGSVRDAILGESRDVDFEIDFTTNARPDDIERLMKPLCTSIWEQGRAFGTIGGMLREGDFKVEITTYRSEEYVDHSRKPAVVWGDSLEADLSRRDFTINALALDVVALDAGTPDVQTLFDYYNGFRDLHERVLRTPIDPELLFSDDPLRMLRAARFAARFHLRIDAAVEAIVGTRNDEGQFEGGTLAKFSMPVEGNMIAQVGTISANSDAEIGATIAEARE